MVHGGQGLASHLHDGETEFFFSVLGEGCSHTGKALTASASLFPQPRFEELGARSTGLAYRDPHHLRSVSKLNSLEMDW